MATEPATTSTGRLPPRWVMSRMLESAETPAPVLKLDTEVVFSLLQDLVIEEAERSPFGLVVRLSCSRSLGDLFSDQRTVPVQ